MQNKIIDFLLKHTTGENDEYYLKVMNTTNQIISWLPVVFIIIWGFLIGTPVEAVGAIIFTLVFRGKFLNKLHAKSAEECAKWSFTNYAVFLVVLALIKYSDITTNEIIVMCSLMITTTISHSNGLKEKQDRDNKDILIEPLSGEQKKIYDSFIRVSLMRDYETEKVQESLSWLEKRNPFYKHVSDLLFRDKLSIAQVAKRTDYSDPQIRRIQEIILSKFDYYIKDL